jgi:ElaB/YqjD/DUF883 family membrane-anchored ribosome-binding protein
MEYNEREKLAELGSEAGRRAAETGERVAATAQRTAAKFGDQMKNFAGKIRDTGPQVESAVRNSAERLAEKLERGGSYFTDRRYEDTTRKVTQYVRQHPVMSLMIGIAAGLLLASKRRHH